MDKKILLNAVTSKEKIWDDLTETCRQMEAAMDKKILLNAATSKEMTWGDLIESCRQYDLFCKPRNTSIIDWFHIGALIFYETGEIKASGITIAENRTPQQMKIIIDNLKG